MKTNSDKFFKNSLNELLMQNEPVWQAVQLASQINLPNWYIGAGCIAQTVWNHFHDYDLHNHINDIDFVYFDKDDLSYQAENQIIDLVKSEFANINLPIDVKNQARVHLWYKNHFGYDIIPYESSEDAIKTWPTTATSIGVKLVDQDLQIFSPFGLIDLFNLIVRPNKVQITEAIYLAKVKKWIKHWPKLKIMNWS